MTELKRCPFCGSEAKLNSFHDDMVYCQNKYCLTGSSNKPVDIWQKRPIEDELNARIKELERQVDEYHKFYWGNGRLNNP